MALLQYTTLCTIILTAVVTTIPVLCGVQMIPERVQVVYMNEKYLYNYSSVVKRYSRGSTVYYITAETTLKHEWDNNVTMNIVYNEFLHNEYRRSFIELHYKYCDMLNNDKYFGAYIVDFGFKCPLVAEKRHVLNFTAPTGAFPNVFPFERARTDMEITVTATSESILKVYFYAQYRNVLHKH